MIIITIKEGIFYSWTLEDYEKAISDFTKAIDLDPKIHIIIFIGAMLIEIMNSTTMH